MKTNVQDDFLFYADGLKSFPKALTAVYPKAELQRSMIRQIRYSI